MTASGDVAPSELILPWLPEGRTVVLPGRGEVFCRWHRHPDPEALWSTVVSHARQPVVDVGRRKAPSGSRTPCSSPAVSSRTGRASVSAM